MTKSKQKEYLKIEITNGALGDIKIDTNINDPSTIIAILPIVNGRIIDGLAAPNKRDELAEFVAEGTEAVFRELDKHKAGETNENSK